jgi:hypothetical protein
MVQTQCCSNGFKIKRDDNVGYGNRPLKFETKKTNVITKLNVVVYGVGGVVTGRDWRLVVTPSKNLTTFWWAK